MNALSELHLEKRQRSERRRFLCRTWFARLKSRLKSMFSFQSECREKSEMRILAVEVIEAVNDRMKRDDAEELLQRESNSQYWESEGDTIR